MARPATTKVASPGKAVRSKAKPSPKAKRPGTRKSPGAAREAAAEVDGSRPSDIAPQPETVDGPVSDSRPTASDVHCVTTREPIRNQLAEDVERFLAHGGKIQEIPRNLRADPPRKPENNYGRGSI